MVTKKLTQEFSRTESRILGALYKLDEFLLNPQTQTLHGTIPGTSRNNDLENREPTGDHSQSDPHPKVESSACRTSNSVDSDERQTSHIYISEKIHRWNHLHGVFAGFYTCAIFAVKF